MFGTLRGALAGRRVAFDRDTFKATVAGRISGIGKTIRITSIHVHYDLAVPVEAREATERALHLHPEGCPAHQSVKDAIVDHLGRHGSHRQRGGRASGRSREPQETSRAARRAAERNPYPARTVPRNVPETFEYPAIRGECETGTSTILAPSAAALTTISTGQPDARSRMRRRDSKSVRMARSGPTSEMDRRQRQA